jgi:hypothetical protein
MSTQLLEFGYTAGQSLTAELFAIKSDAVVATAASVSEAINRGGRYVATFEDVPAGRYLMVYSVGGTAAGTEIYLLSGDSETVMPDSEEVIAEVRKIPVPAPSDETKVI